MRLRKPELFATFARAVADAGWHLLQLPARGRHPWRVRVFSDAESHLVRLHMWNLTHGGGARRPADEYRIQVTGVTRFEPEPDGLVLILGWWPDGEVFAGFDYDRHRGRLGASPSIQVREP